MAYLLGLVLAFSVITTSCGKTDAAPQPQPKPPIPSPQPEPTPQPPLPPHCPCGCTLDMSQVTDRFSSLCNKDELSQGYLVKQDNREYVRCVKLSCKCDTTCPTDKRVE